MNTLALQVQEGLGRDPHAGEIFCFRGRRGDLVKILWHDGVGMSLYLKRLEAGSSSGRAPAVARQCRSRRRSSAIFWKVRRDQETVRWTVSPDVKLAQFALDPTPCKGRINRPPPVSFPWACADRHGKF
ncbi:IS66 family insertion sequence element accessory protein TnpB [Roseovarius autotrophicus]|uniref:IS66 family insertion sequence element accessory protein TnpB n=1 Tax=Roseovarius autotrophicus TaxID=2824121 RepID=UPI003AB98E09